VGDGFLDQIQDGFGKGLVRGRLLGRCGRLVQGGNLHFEGLHLEPRGRRVNGLKRRLEIVGLRSNIPRDSQQHELAGRIVLGFPGTVEHLLSQGLLFGRGLGRGPFVAIDLFDELDGFGLGRFRGHGDVLCGILMGSILTPSRRGGGQNEEHGERKRGLGDFHGWALKCHAVASLIFLSIEIRIFWPRMKHGLNTDFQNLESVFNPCFIRGRKGR